MLIPPCWCLKHLLNWEPWPTLNPGTAEGNSNNSKALKGKKANGTTTHNIDTRRVNLPSTFLYWQAMKVEKYWWPEKEGREELLIWGDLHPGDVAEISPAGQIWSFVIISRWIERKDSWMKSSDVHGTRSLAVSKKSALLEDIIEKEEPQHDIKRRSKCLPI